MIQKILSAMAVVADVLTILSVWFINDESPLWLKILITTIAIIIGIVMVVLTYDAYDIKIKRYYYKGNEFRVYTKKNKYLVAGSVVSIYYKYVEREEEHDDLVALGCVIIDDKSSEIQIKIFNIVDEQLMGNILSSDKSYRKYHVKPNVEFSRISEIVINESEVNNNA